MEKNKLRELVEQAKQGSRWAMSQLMEEYKHPVQGTCRAVIRDEAEADRLAQEAFQTAFDRISELGCADDFLPWVTQIAKEKCGGMRVSTGSALERKKPTGLRRQEKSTALSTGGEPNALSTDVKYPQTAQNVPAKKKSPLAGILIAAAALLVVALLAGVAVLFAGRKNLPVTGDSGETMVEYIFVSDDDALRAYAEFFDSNYSTGSDKVCFADVTGDGAEEMLVIQRPNNEESWLHIYNIRSGSVKEIYNVDENGPLESMGIVALCEYDGRQCLYERVVYSWTENGSYEEAIFYLDENGKRITLEEWNEETDAEPLVTSIFHFSDFEEIRNLGVWARDAFAAAE